MQVGVLDATEYGCSIFLIDGVTGDAHGKPPVEAEGKDQWWNMKNRVRASGSEMVQDEQGSKRRKRSDAKM